MMEIDIREYAREHNLRFVLSDEYIKQDIRTVPIIDMVLHPEYDETWLTEIVSEMNSLHRENEMLRGEVERLKTSNSWLRANRKDCEKGRRFERKQWLKFDEMRLEQLRDMHKIVQEEYMKRIKAEYELKKKARRDYTSRRLYDD